MKYYYLLLSIFLTTFNHNGTCQSADYSSPLPRDTSIKKGVLDNGMTYYIKSTDVVKDAASYYIIQNVGSILENDDQQGLAHFLEHMAFNGTETFPGKGILNTLQKHGAVFGKDINAYTSFDETVYNLNNIPTKDGLVDTCLTVLKDWSNNLLLTAEEIDAERGVIKEEWRTRQSGQMRLFQTSLPITYNNSKYADRLPIGLMSVVENFDHDTLRKFYHDWYRTELQAIAVIGDIDANEIEEKIKTIFSKIPAVANPKERVIVDIPENETIMYSLGTDPEVSTASISFGIRHKKASTPETIADLKRSLLESMATRLLSSRFAEKAQKPETSFLGVRLGYGTLSRTSNNFAVNIYPKPNLQQEAFEEAMTEVIRAVKFGYTQSEIDRAILEIKSNYENQIAKEGDRSHASIERTIQSNYLFNTTITDISEEFEIAKRLLNSITSAELHNTIKRLYAQNNRYVNVTGVDGHNNLTEQEVKQLLNKVESDQTIVPYKEALDGKTLVSDLNITKGRISKKTNNSTIEATSFLLSNGINVHYKYVDKEKDKVALRAISYGGTSLINEDDLPSAGLMSDLVRMSGLGDFNASDLKKVLSGKTSYVRVGVEDISENISGSSNAKDVETMLQMVHLYFVKPRFDEQAYKVLLSNIDNYLIRRSKDIGEIMRDSLTVAVYGKDHPRKQLFNQEYVDNVSFEAIKRIYHDRFSDASDFEFFIVGDVHQDQLEPLLETYIASIPTGNMNESFAKNTAQWSSNTINKEIRLEMEDPKARINLEYKNEMPFTIKNKILADALGDILQLRVTETVRESEGGAYSPRATASLSREPESVATISFNFDCNPELADKLVDIVNQELEKIADGNITLADLSKTKTNFIKEREQAKDKNYYDMQWLYNYYRFDENIDDPKNYQIIVESMSVEDIQDIANRVLNGGKSYEVVFKPKS